MGKIREWLREWLGIEDIDKSIAAHADAINLLDYTIHKNSLTQPPSSAHSKNKGPLSGSRLRVLNDRLNATVPEPTQQEKLENHG
jgi:hypothetical protein